ncbi:SAUR-like auxin-responsive protein family [Striga asiatica]|uniref:SAUR-like auxin-responsive protein family n=1 Tax=Striga asiatica TaxID=4170 RepID=A0A5A7NW01_STRAF|nr:SAUR-like auxin-responsive protein family [Striga asiatica]
MLLFSAIGRAPPHNPTYGISSHWWSSPTNSGPLPVLVGPFPALVGPFSTLTPPALASHFSTSASMTPAVDDHFSTTDNPTAAPPPPPSINIHGNTYQVLKYELKAGITPNSALSFGSDPDPSAPSNSDSDLQTHSPRLEFILQYLMSVVVKFGCHGIRAENAVDSAEFGDTEEMIEDMETFLRKNFTLHDQDVLLEAFSDQLLIAAMFFTEFVLMLWAIWGFGKDGWSMEIVV